MGQEIDRQNKQLDKVGAKVKHRLNILHSFILNFLYRPSMLTTKLVTPIREQRTSWSDGWDCTFNHEDVIFLICGCVCMRFLYYIYTIRYRYGVRTEITFKKDCFYKMSSYYCKWAYLVTVWSGCVRLPWKDPHSVVIWYHCPFGNVTGGKKAIIRPLKMSLVSNKHCSKNLKSTVIAIWISKHRKLG